MRLACTVAVSLDAGRRVPGGELRLRTRRSRIPSRRGPVTKAVLGQLPDLQLVKIADGRPEARGDG